MNIQKGGTVNGGRWANARDLIFHIVIDFQMNFQLLTRDKFVNISTNDCHAARLARRNQWKIRAEGEHYQLSRADGKYGSHTISN